MGSSVTKRSPRLALITGATGGVGPAVVRLFGTRGWRIRAIARHAPPRGLLPETVEFVAADVSERALIESAMREVDVVVHLAAKLHTPNAHSLAQSEYEKINVDGTASIVAAAVEAGVARLVFFSTISVYGSSMQRILRESSPLYPETFYAKTKASAEQIVLSAVRSDGEALGTVLRLASVYGPRMSGSFRRLAEALAAGWFIPAGPGGNCRALVYDGDVAEAAILAAEHPAAAGNVYNLSDNRAHSMKEIIDAICTALGRPPPAVYVPLRLARLAARLAAGTAPLFGSKAFVLGDALDKFTENVEVDSTRIQRELGFRPGHDLVAGWKVALADIRKSKLRSGSGCCRD